MLTSFHDLNRRGVALIFFVALARGIRGSAERRRILETDDVASASEHATDAVVTHRMLRRRRDLTREFKKAAAVKRRAARRLDVRRLDFVKVRRTHHIGKAKRRAHDRVVGLDPGFAHAHERARVVRVPEEAGLTAQTRGAQPELLRELGVVRKVLKVWVLGVVSLVRTGARHIILFVCAFARLRVDVYRASRPRVRDSRIVDISRAGDKTGKRGIRFRRFARFDWPFES
jgi:hypothetical protein